MFKRYLIFGFRQYYPNGGMNDFKFSTDDPSSIKDSKWFTEEFLDWCMGDSDTIQIYDSKSNICHELDLYGVDSREKIIEEYDEFIPTKQSTPPSTEGRVEMNVIFLNKYRLSRDDFLKFFSIQPIFFC